MYVYFTIFVFIIILYYKIIIFAISNSWRHRTYIRYLRNDPVCYLLSEFVMHGSVTGPGTVVTGRIASFIVSCIIKVAKRKNNRLNNVSYLLLPRIFRHF